MKKFSKKGILLFAGAMAVCAFVLPSVASAASWGPIPSHHVLDSPNIGFTSATAGGTTSQCTRSSFTANVTSAQNLEITLASFGGLCTISIHQLGDCTATAVPSRLPWTATATTTGNIQLHGVHIAIAIETLPGASPPACNGIGLSLTVTGTLTGGNWTGNASHSLDFNNAEGLVSHSALGVNTPITTRGLLTDTQNTLVVN